MSYSIIEIQTIRKNIQHQKLNAPEAFLQLLDSQLKDIINGYGPDSWDDSVRDVLTWVYRYYQESAAIHDVRYWMSTGLEADRACADNEFYQNLKIQWRIRYGWSRWVNPIAIYGYTKINLAYKAVELFGSESYLKGYAKN